MSLKWSSGVVDNSILRKKEQVERKDELLVFGYSCKLFRDDEKALFIDQGKHLIPWMGDDSLKIDRYDARGALHDLSRVEAPPGGHDWRLELTDAEKRVELLCDEERYRALHTNEDEEEMYKEEELKRLHSMGGKYGQVGFNYESNGQTEQRTAPESLKTEDDEPFEASDELKILMGEDIVLPETKKLNAIIEKTALFIAQQGVQMEIFLKAKQSGNTQFDFLSLDCPLNQYYKKLVDLLKMGRYHIGEKKSDESEEMKDDKLNDHYLHPSLAAPVVESAPSIPSIHYKPSADCDYTMLITKITGTNKLEEESQFEETHEVSGDVAPPGTLPLELPSSPNPKSIPSALQSMKKVEISKGPILYDKRNESQQPTSRQVVNSERYQHDVTAQSSIEGSYTPRTATDSGSNSPAPSATAKSLGLNLMHYYNSDSDGGTDGTGDSSADSESEEEKVEEPPEDIHAIISKMATYVARNGDNFEDVVKARNDPRFTFLESGHVYHQYYQKLKRKVRSGDAMEKKAQEKREEKERKQKEKRRQLEEAEKKKKSIAPVSFSIKKLKEPEPALPKPALPYESSSEDEDAKNLEEKKSQDDQKSISEQRVEMPPTVIYRIEPKTSNEKSECVTNEKKDVKENSHKKSDDKVENPVNTEVDEELKEKNRARRSPEIKLSEAKVENKEEVISIDLDDIDDANELIDLTGDNAENKEEIISQRNSRRAERKARATAFLASIAGGAAPAENNSSLASVLVKTLTKLEAKKEEEERRATKKKKKKHHRHKEEDDNDYREDRSHRKSKRRRERSRTPAESSRKRYTEEQNSVSKPKKHKKEKKHKSSHKSKRDRHSPEDVTKHKKSKKSEAPENTASNGRSTPQKVKETSKEKNYSEGECDSDDNDSKSVSS